MTRSVAVLRPEPGNAATVGRLRSAGLVPIACPLFVVRPLPWETPEGTFDALVLTSANAVRHAGSLASVAALPVYAVGPATARAASDAGLHVVRVGDGDARSLLRAAGDAGMRRGLMLAGRDRMVERAAGIAAIVETYASMPSPVDGNAVDRVVGQVALLHSARAARRFRALLSARQRGTIRLAAFSAAVAEAAGSGWERVVVAERPDDAALVALASGLAD